MRIASDSTGFSPRGVWPSERWPGNSERSSTRWGLHDRVLGMIEGTRAPAVARMLMDLMSSSATSSVIHSPILCALAQLTRMLVYVDYCDRLFGGDDMRTRTLPIAFIQANCVRQLAACR
jgi:hypothetical protein